MNALDALRKIVAEKELEDCMDTANDINVNGIKTIDNIRKLRDSAYLLGHSLDLIIAMCEDSEITDVEDI